MTLQRSKHWLPWRIVLTSEKPRARLTVTRRLLRPGRTLECVITRSKPKGDSYTLYEKRHFDMRTRRRHSNTTSDSGFDRRFFMDGGTYGRTMAVMTAPVRTALVTLANAGLVEFANHQLKFRGTVQNEAEAHALWPTLQLVFEALSEPFLNDADIFERIAERFSDEPNERVRASFCYYVNATRSPRGYKGLAKTAKRDPSDYVRACFAGYAKDYTALMEVFASSPPNSDARNHCAYVLAHKDNNDASFIEQALLIGLTSDLYFLDLIARLAALRGKDAIPAIERAIAEHTFTYERRKPDALAVLSSLGSELGGQLSLTGASGGEISRA